MSDYVTHYHLGAIRKLLTSAFTAETLRYFCRDRPLFRPVLNAVGPKEGLNGLVEGLVVHCEVNMLFDELLAAVKDVNPRVYKYFERELVGPGGAQRQGAAAFSPASGGPAPPEPLWHEFTLEIDRDGLLRARLHRSDGSSTPRAEGRLPTDRLLRDTIDQGRARLRAGKGLDPGSIEILGKALYHALFPGEIAKLFEHGMQSVIHDRFTSSRDVRLRLIVEVSPDSELFWWPLELIYYDDGKDRGWLATDSLPVLLSRRTRVIGSKVPPPESLPLRILLMMSNPLDGVMPFDTLVAILGAGQARELEIRVLVDRDIEGVDRDRAGDIVCAGRPEFGVIDELSWGQWHPHVLHFVGHGQFEEVTRKGALALARGAEVDWCLAGDLGEVLGRLRPRVVLLQACERAAPGTEWAFMSLVDDLIRADIPAIVATQLSIPSKSAIDFAIPFYETLISGGNIDDAVQRGRRRIFRDVRGKSPHFAGPVLFTYDPAAPIERAV
ncbi:MAG: CHAT domain-containing protein [Anaerolineae bacterium]|nr:CHAT domain-containing protein [Anaerolineae bacterium]